MQNDGWVELLKQRETQRVGLPVPAPTSLCGSRTLPVFKGHW